MLNFVILMVRNFPSREHNARCVGDFSKERYGRLHRNARPRRSTFAYQSQPGYFMFGSAWQAEHRTGAVNTPVPLSGNP